MDLELCVPGRIEKARLKYQGTQKHQTLKEIIASVTLLVNGEGRERSDSARTKREIHLQRITTLSDAIARWSFHAEMRPNRKETTQISSNLQFAWVWPSHGKVVKTQAFDEGVIIPALVPALSASP